MQQLEKIAAKNASDDEGDNEAHPAVETRPGGRAVLSWKAEAAITEFGSDSKLLGHYNTEGENNHATNSRHRRRPTACGCRCGVLMSPMILWHSAPLTLQSREISPFPGFYKLFSGSRTLWFRHDFVAVQTTGS